ncbi:MAG: phage antirepressor KilAC domain-containing protein [Bacilli bacterium]|nr:phage antirepressor KilAC domain-containing protein [Bacilli bacterium]
MANELIKTNPNAIETVDNYNPDFGNVRHVIIDGEVWLCGLDVCEAFGYTNTRDALKRHVKVADVVKRDARSHGQTRKMVFINSRGFYDLCQGSKLPNANQIKDWIKSKFFTAVENNNLSAVAIDALVTNQDFANKVGDRVVDVLTDEASKYRALRGSNSLLPMKEVADHLAIAGIGRNTLFRILRERGILTSNNEPYREYIENGWFRRVESEYTTISGVHVSFTTKATVKGLDNIKRLLKEWGYC